MKRTLPIIPLALTVVVLSQANFAGAQPPMEQDPWMGRMPLVAPPMPSPFPKPPPIYADPAPSLRTGAWWYGALIPIQHQRDVYYPNWDTPVLTCLGYPAFGAPAYDIPQSAMPTYWCRIGQGWQPGTPLSPPTPPGTGASAAAPTASEGRTHPPTVP